MASLWPPQLRQLDPPDCHYFLVEGRNLFLSLSPANVCLPGDPLSLASKSRLGSALSGDD